MDEKKFINLYERQKESGLTVKEFCAHEIIAPATFYYWKKKLSNQKRLPGFIPVVVEPEPTLVVQGNLPGNGVAPTSGKTDNSTAIEIEFANKAILRISGGVDISMLKALINLND